MAASHWVTDHALPADRILAKLGKLKVEKLTAELWQDRFCTAKKHSVEQTQHTNYEKIFSIDTSDKGKSYNL